TLSRISIAFLNKKLKEDIKTTYSDLSRPPGFDFMKKSSSSTSKFSTSFASHKKRDIKGVSLINELNQIIEVGTALRLRDFMHHNDGSYIFFRDMNVIRNEQERYGSSFNSIEADHFNDFIESTCLIDLPIRRRSFTWMNKAEWNMLDVNLKCHDKFRCLKAKIRQWSSINKTRKSNRKVIALEELSSIEKKINDGSASQADKENRINIIHEIEKLDSLESIDLLKKLISNGMLKFYEVKFQAQDDHVVFPNLPYSLTLDNKDRDNLERRVNLDEIKEAIWDCGSSKASVNNPTCVTDFRPISLIGIHYKITAKILANRLAKVIDKIISKEQSAFIAGRQILDGPLIITEIIEWGLRQGDPLSHFLFILIMKGLHNALADAMTKGLISGVTLNNSNINISYLFYADDVIITSEWNARELENIIRVLHIFYLASGLKINIHKSNIYGIGVNDEDVSSMVHNVGCISGAFPFTYLGLPIGSNMNFIAMLGSLGIYYFSIYRAPQTVLYDLEIIRSDFFWGGNKDTKKMAWVKWSNTIASLDKGGLNINSLKAFNLALLQKWHWRMLSTLNSYGLRLLKRFMVKKVALILMVVNSRVPGQILLVRRTSFIRKVLSLLILLNLKQVADPEIDFGKTYGWPRTNLGSPNLSYFRDMLNEIGDVNIEVTEDTCYWSLGSNGIYTVKEARKIIDLKTLPLLDLQSTWDKVLPRTVNIFL
nr:putative ribonuclease H protein At1g65750 family [Tanacetum cinerariifolium]